LRQEFNFLSVEETNSIVENSTVQNAKRELVNIVGEPGNVSFFIDKNTLLPSIQDKLSNAGIQLQDEVPMRWFRGDIPQHIDQTVGEQSSNLPTYLIYLTTDFFGSLQIGKNNYPIEEGVLYQFAENVPHQTINTIAERLCIGPMNEHGMPVGGTQIVYYADSSLQTTIGYTNEPGVFETVDIVPPQYVPTNGVFLGWYIAAIPYGGTGTYAIGEIVPPGSPYTTYTYYNVYPVFRSSHTSRKLQFTDNSMVFYKPGSLAACGVGTVKNSRWKSKHT